MTDEPAGATAHPAEREGAEGACDRCLRRGYLVGRLAGRIAGLLDRPGRRTAGLLGLDDGDLVAAAGGDEAGVLERFLEGFDPGAARRALERGGVRAVCRHSARYPPQLGGLDDAPRVLFVAGPADADAALREQRAVTLVGTRRPSPHGRVVAYELGRGLAAAGVTVISGLALGVDAEAHRGCLAGGGLPLAVLACGPDIAYPRTNRRLYERIRERGLVVSELPPGQCAYRWSFPARNRIMAGLAAMTVVVEAANPSGSLITSAFAGDLGRSIGAVPGHVTAAVASGTNQLLKDGARVVTCPQDVLDELYGAGGSGPAQARADGAAVAAPARPAGPSALLLDAVEAGFAIDEICEHAGLPVREARAGLARLEASGHVRRDALGAYCRTVRRR